MMRELASALRFPAVPAASSQAPMEAACPMHVVSMAGRTNCIVS